MPDYLTKYASGLRYFRAVPKELRDVVGRDYWYECLGKVPHREAQARAVVLAARDQKIIDGVQRLSPSERDAIKQAGGLKAWAQVQQGVALEATGLRRAAEIEPDDDMPDEMQDVDLLAAARACRELVNIEKKTAAAAKITHRFSDSSGALLTLVDLHAKVRQPCAEAIQKARLYVRRFIDVVGDLSPTAVSRDDVIKFRDHLEADGQTPHNVRQHLKFLHALFNTALSEGVVTSNPTHLVKARGNGKLSGGKEGFDAAQMKRIFAALDGETPDFQWIIRLLAYHGARSGEICQLKWSDVTTLSGVDVIRIHGKNGSVKNRQSVRDIPVHPKCKAIVAYAAKLAKTHGADAWLFTSLTGQRRGHCFQKYANKEFLRDKVGITARAAGSRTYDQSIHSLRHAFSTACREAEMPDAVKYALMGHALGKGEGGKYGEGPSLKLRSNWLAKVDPLNG